MSKQTALMVASGFSRIMMQLLFLVLLLVLHVHHVDSHSKTEVEVLSLFHNKHVPARITNAINAGVGASFAARKIDFEGLRVAVNLTNLRQKNHSTIELLERRLSQLSGTKKILAVLGPIGDATILRVIPYLDRHKVVAFAPVSGSAAVRGWKQSLYFLTPDPMAEVLALLRYALGQLRVLRLGFMYLKKVSLGEDEYESVVNVLDRMGYKLCGVFALEGSLDGEASESAFNYEWAKFASTYPQAVIVFGLPIKDTEKFLTEMGRDRRTKDAYILAPLVLQGAIVRVLKSRASLNIECLPGRFILTGTSPLAKDVGHRSIARFQKEMKSYLESHGEIYNISNEHFLHDDIEGEMMVYGWITGEILFRALNSRQWLKNREEFISSLYSQRRYVIDDIVYGDYGGDCRDDISALGAMCHCNQGGKTVYIKKLTCDIRLEGVPSGFIAMGVSQCNTDVSRLRTPLPVLVPLMNDNRVALDAAGEWSEGANALSGTGRLGDYDRLFFHWINTTSKSIWWDLRNEEREKSVVAVMGIVDEAALYTKSYIVVDPVLVTPRLTEFNEHVIYLSPTLEQQLFVIAVHLPRNVEGGVHAIIRGYQSYYIERTLNLMVESNGNNLAFVMRLGMSEPISPYIPNRGHVFLVGITQDDIEGIARHLDDHPTSHVYVVFTDIALYYKQFVKVFANRPSRNRLLFATNLPHWADANTQSETVRRFHNAMKNKSKWTPLSLMGFCAGRLLQETLLVLDKVNGSTLSDVFFRKTYIRADDMRYGPFVNAQCSGTSTRPMKGCRTNFGATQISLWSFARALDPSVASVTKPTSEPPLLIDPEEWEIVRNKFVIAGISLSAIFVVVAAALVGRFCIDSRDNDNAPKDLTEPVTLIFTDIESSTAQWAAHPELMREIVATHHRIIRSLIVWYGCYEVKTVGDSFMIACRCPLAAVQLACDLQRCFLHHDWGTTVLDDSYRKFEELKAEEDAEYKPPTACLDPEVYRQLWNGLRVRVGIHTGLCDIRHDEVTKGYDYYGQTTNMAARTESIANGGQVLLTHATYYSLSTAERKHFDVTSLGPVSLRGVREPVEVYQLNAVPGRTFAALRLENEGLDDECEEGTEANSDVGSVLTDRNDFAHRIALSLSSLLSGRTAIQRQTMLTLLCRWWCILLPRTRGTWDDARCKDVQRLLSEKAARIARLGTPSTISNTTNSMQVSHRCEATYHGMRLPGTPEHAGRIQPGGGRGPAAFHRVEYDDSSGSSFISIGTVRPIVDSPELSPR